MLEESKVNVPPMFSVTPPSVLGRGNEPAEKVWLTPVDGKALARDPGATPVVDEKDAALLMPNEFGAGGAF